MTEVFSPAEKLAEKVASFAGCRVAIVGDVMLDRYLVGGVTRISPEAPVPVVEVLDERAHLGGAGNVAENIIALGGEALLVSYVGDDANGETLRAKLVEAGVDARLVLSPDRPTPVKTRVMAQNQQVVRIDRESSASLSTAVLDTIFGELERVAADTDVLILSDYGKGLVCDAFMQRLEELQARLPRPFRILIDPKTKNFARYDSPFLVTPNAKEAAEGAGAEPLEERIDVLRAGLALFRRVKCRHLLITLGAQGMALFESPSRVWHIPTVARRVFDVTGAGDTVIATIGLALSAGVSLPDACLLANFAAGIVVGEIGTASVTPQQLAEAATQPLPEVSSWLAEA